MRFLCSTLLLLYLSLWHLPSAWAQDQKALQLNAQEALLLKLLNEERIKLNLPKLTIIPGLQRVARAHVKDLTNHPPIPPCNLHSWSSNGNWSACCYTSDHKQAAKMWSKPKEVAGMDENGFEIAFAHSQKATPEEAMKSWKESPSHYPLISNQGAWSDNQWIGVGVAIAGQYAVIWFAEKASN